MCVAKIECRRRWLRRRRDLEGRRGGAEDLGEKKKEWSGRAGLGVEKGVGDGMEQGAEEGAKVWKKELKK